MNSTENGSTDSKNPAAPTSPAGFRKISNPFVNFDPTDPLPVGKPAEPVTSPLQRFSLPSRNIRAVIEFVAGLILTLFGAFTAGSYFNALSRFRGILATIFYEWQIATIILIVGLIMMYSALQRKQ